MRAVLTKSCVHNHNIKTPKTKRDAVHSPVIRPIFYIIVQPLTTLSLGQEQKAVPTLAIPQSTPPPLNSEPAQEHAHTGWNLTHLGLPGPQNSLCKFRRTILSIHLPNGGLRQSCSWGTDVAKICRAGTGRLAMALQPTWPNLLAFCAKSTKV